MCDRSHPEKVAIVTTSWDDGHPLDLRLAQLLASHGILGTFYMALRYNNFPRMSKEQMRIIRQMGMEIGSHTLTHPILTKLDQSELLRELHESKTILEDMLRESIVSLCYPKGKFNRRVCLATAEAGYQLARTTVAFRPEIHFDPFRMPVSFQFFPHTCMVHVCHALKRGNLKGITNWCRFWRAERDLPRLATFSVEYILKHGGIMHLWGHSWEVEKYGLWDLLEEVLRRIAHRPGVLYLTNSQVLNVISQ